jgi:hypothetical protein
VNLPLSADQPSHGKIELNIENQSEETLGVFWTDDTVRSSHHTRCALPSSSLLASPRHTTLLARPAWKARAHVLLLSQNKNLFLTGLPPGGTSRHGTVNGHRFVITKGDNDVDGAVIKKYTVLAALGSPQKIVINRGMFPRREETWINKLFKWEL